MTTHLLPLLESRWRALIALLVAGALAMSLVACSSSDKDGDKSSAPGNAEVATGGARFGTADEETAKLGSDAQPGQFPRTVKHASGETEIKQKPQRIVVLDTGELDDVLSLGMKPVGMVTTKGAQPVPTYLADQVKDVPSVGTINELNVEKIAELKPDLILGSQLRADKLYPQLSEIAPTVFSIRPGFPWKENFLLIGDATGEEKKAEDKLNEYADKAAKVRESAPADTKVSLVRFMPERLRLYGNKSLIGVILRDAGFVRPDKQNIDELAVEISPENINEADGDLLFYSSYGKPDATGMTNVTSGSAWQNLEAVKSKHAFEVNDDVWFLGLGPTGAMQILDDLQKHVSK